MKKALLVIACLLAITAGVSAKGAKQPLPEELPSTPRFSNQFKIFWGDFVYEYNNGKKALKKFKPSKEMAEYYTLQKQGKKYLLTGYIQTQGNDFNEEEVSKMGIKVHKMIDGIYSFRCPLYLLPDLIQLKGMKTVEAGTQLKRLH